MDPDPLFLSRNTGLRQRPSTLRRSTEDERRRSHRLSLSRNTGSQQQQQHVRGLPNRTAIEAGDGGLHARDDGALLHMSFCFGTPDSSDRYFLQSLHGECASTVAMASSRPLSVLLLLLVSVVCLSSTCNAIYEDQVGMRDWYAFAPEFLVFLGEDR